MSSIHQHHSPLNDGIGVREGVSRGLKMLGAGVWGLALGVIGMWILFDPGLPGFLGRLSGLERGLVGLGMLIGGQLVFLLFVAERIFVRTPRMMTSVVHWVLFVLGSLCVVLVVGARMFFGGA